MGYTPQGTTQVRGTPSPTWTRIESKSGPIYGPDLEILFPHLGHGIQAMWNALGDSQSTWNSSRRLATYGIRVGGHLSINRHVYGSHKYMFS